MDSGNLSNNSEMEYDVLAEGAKQRRNITLAKAHYDVSSRCCNITRCNMTSLPDGAILRRNYYDILLKALHKA